MDKFHRRLASGEVLFREGDPGTCAYIVEEGALEVWTGPAHQPKVLARLGPESLIGEMALVARQPRLASVTALEPTLLGMITREHFSERLASSDPLLRHVLDVILRRYRDLLERLDGDALTLSDVQHSDPRAQEGAERHDHDQAMHRLRVEQELELALERDELRLFYQPIVRLADNAVAGFEALLRWQTPAAGLISPALFIPVIEESSLITRIGHWIFSQSCQDLVALQRQCRTEVPLTMSVNLSTRQFFDPNLLMELQAALQRQRVPAEQLRLEVTESLLLDNWEMALDLLQRAKALGVRLAMDDFGTGYSSLAYLHRFPVDTLKLDQVFVRNMLDDNQSLCIVRWVAGLARALGMDFIAEGIEQPAEADALREMGVGYGQGYLYGAAMPLAEAVAYLQSGGPARSRSHASLEAAQPAPPLTLRG